MKCKKCDNSFTPQFNLKEYCSLKCRNSRKISNEIIKIKRVKCNICNIEILVGKRASISNCKCLNCIDLERNNKKLKRKELVKKRKERRGKNLLISERMKKQWKDVNYRIYMINKIIKYNLDPEVKKRKKDCAHNRIVTFETRNKLSQFAKKNNLGGHTSKLKLYYKTKNNIVYLQSSYEIDVAKELDENNINWIRPEPLNWLDANKIEHKYYPDFYLNDYNVYLDTKNDYLILKDAEKINNVKEQNKIKLFVLNKNQLKWNEIKLIIES